MTVMQRAFLPRRSRLLPPLLRHARLVNRRLKAAAALILSLLLLRYAILPEPRNRPLLHPWYTYKVVYEEGKSRIRPWPGPVERTTELPSRQFRQHDICGGCRLNLLGEANTNRTCGQWMDEYLVTENNLTMGQAGVQAAKRFPQHCQRCAPSACTADGKQYWTLDGAAPRVITSRSLRLTFPDYYRLPEDSFERIEHFFKLPSHQHPFVFEWNPSIVVLPRDQIPKRHWDNSPRDTPKYLAVFRMTKKQNCFRASKDFQQFIGPKAPLYKTEFVDLAGIALLRDDFSILEEGFFDFRRIINKLQDLRLHVFPPAKNSPESRIYISSLHEVTRLWLRPPANAFNKQLYFDFFERSANPLALFLEDRASCCRTCQGKNFNYFQDSTGKIVVETLPLGPHVVDNVDFGANCYDNNTWDPHWSGRVVQDAFVPEPSFYTSDELYFLERGIYNLPYSSEHGTACCASIPDPRNKGETLLVGVSHTKSVLGKEDKAIMRKAKVNMEARQYISRFYAFERHAPYRVVALSGGFCMPFANKVELKENFNNKLVGARPFKLGKLLACPYISFLSGITEKADDPSSVIISYGINDCTNRIVEVSKEEIVQMLFDPTARIH